MQDCTPLNFNVFCGLPWWRFALSECFQLLTQLRWVFSGFCANCCCSLGALMSVVLTGCRCARGPRAGRGRCSAAVRRSLLADHCVHWSSTCWSTCYAVAGRRSPADGAISRTCNRRVRRVVQSQPTSRPTIIHRAAVRGVISGGSGILWGRENRECSGEVS